MAIAILPVNIDTTYVDSGTDASVQLHQAHHDASHTVVNGLSQTTTAQVGSVLAADSTTTTGIVWTNGVRLRGGATAIPGVDLVDGTTGPSTPAPGAPLSDPTLYRASQDKMGVRGWQLKLGPRQDNLTNYALSGGYSALFVIEGDGATNDRSILWKTSTPNQTYWELGQAGESLLRLKSVHGTHVPYAETFVGRLGFTYPASAAAWGESCWTLTNVAFASPVEVWNTNIFGGASGCVAIQNRTVAPTASPVGGGILYAQAGALRWRGSSGTDTQLAAA